MGGVLAVPLLSVVYGCPPRDIAIDVTERGIRLVVDDCQCASEKGDSCCSNASGGTKLPIDGAFRLAFRLWLVTPVTGGGAATAHVEAKSACIVSNVRCVPKTPEFARCLADTINADLNVHLKGGLTFADFEDPSQALLIVSLHDPEAATKSARSACSSSSLFACAGLDRVKAQSYDVACAACRNGHVQNASNRPCLGSSCQFTQCFNFVQQDEQTETP
jgi:hypothetical protein